MTPLRAVLEGRKAEGKRIREAVELVQESPDPIVKYVDVVAEYRRQRERKKEGGQKGKTGKEKEIQMTWGVSEADLAHKLNGARHALEHGQRVCIVYTGRKSQAQPTPVEMRAKLESTAKLLSDVGKEWKEAAVTPPATGTVHMEPLNPA